VPPAALIDRYIAEGNDRKIRENESQIEDLKREMTAATEARAAVETNLQATLAELAKSESLRSNIIQNIRYRKGEKEIAKVQEQVDEIDIESAAKARKEFNTRYSKNLQEETHQQNAVSSPSVYRKGWADGSVAISERAGHADEGEPEEARVVFEK
jgi:DNA repair protein RAD50